MINLSLLNRFGAITVKAVAQHFADGAHFVLIGQGPGIHSIIDRSGELWSSETPVLGVMIRYLTLERAKAIYERHCAEYGEQQRSEVLLHAFYGDRHTPSRN